MRSSRAPRSTVATRVTLTTESSSRSVRSADTATLPGSAESCMLVVRTTTVTVRSVERLYRSALMISTGRRSAGAEPLGRPRSAHHTSPRTHVVQHPADDPKLRDVQRARLKQLRDELVAEGADPSKHLPGLQRRADAWPE